MLILDWHVREAIGSNPTLNSVLHEVTKEVDSGRELVYIQDRYNKIFLDVLQKDAMVLSPMYLSSRSYPSIVAEYAQISGKILDVHCGNGALTLALSTDDNVSSIVGIDPSPIAMTVAAQLYNQTGTSDANAQIINKVSFLGVDIEAMSPEPGWVLADSVVSFDSLEWLESPQSFFQMLKTWVKPNAHALFETAIRQVSTRIDRHVNETNLFTNLDGVVNFLSPHMTVVESKEENGLALVLCTL
jgi:2-polyprenyl-3-methyl-5-hydroxy-6-metoxy-1,4-benzoquinol methylase